MDHMEFDFSPEPGWMPAILALPDGSEISAHRFFALLGAVDEDEALEAALALERQGVGLDVSGLPTSFRGPAARRLELEWDLAKAGRLPGGLDPEDPLGVFWRELEATKSARQPESSANLLYLVLEEAPAFAGQGVLLMDLMQEGVLGLLERDPGPDVDTARWHIRQAMARAVAMEYLAGGEAERLVAAMRSYQQADRRLLKELGRNPGPEELARELGKTLEETIALEKMIAGASKASPMQEPEPQEQEEEPESVEDSAYFQLRTRVEELLSQLDDTDRQLLTLRFGLGGKKARTIEEAARSLGLTVDDAMGREMNAILKLRG